MLLKDYQYLVSDSEPEGGEKVEYVFLKTTYSIAPKMRDGGT